MRLPFLPPAFSPKSARICLKLASFDMTILFRLVKEGMKMRKGGATQLVVVKIWRNLESEVVGQASSQHSSALSGWNAPRVLTQSGYLPPTAQGSGSTGKSTPRRHRISLTTPNNQPSVAQPALLAIDLPPAHYLFYFACSAIQNFPIAALLPNCKPESHAWSESQARRVATPHHGSRH